MSRSSRPECCCHVVENLLPESLCEELALVHRTCAVPGYRPRCTSSTLLACPAWSWPALLRARELARDAVEDHFDAFGELWPETTVTVAWLVGSSLPAHSDNCRDYLSHRHISVVIWLSAKGEDFEGGDFFFEEVDEASREVVHVMEPRVGRAVLFDSSIRHGVRPVTRGERLAMNIWFTREAAAAEDVKFLAALPMAPHALPAHERLHGKGPQAEWPPGKDAADLSCLTCLASNLGSRPLQACRHGRLSMRSAQKYLLAALGCAGADETSAQPKPDHRAALALSHGRLAQRKRLREPKSEMACTRLFQHPVSLVRVQRLLELIRRREGAVAEHLQDWLDKGLLASPLVSSRPATLEQNKKKRACRWAHTRGRYTVAEPCSRVPGLAVARGLLVGREQRRLLQATEKRLLPRVGVACGDAQTPNQAMRFGQDIPSWVLATAKRCARVPGLLPPELVQRKPVFDQLIVNCYRPGQGIKSHVDLLKFDDGVMGICLGADAILRMRQLRDDKTSVQPGGECQLEDGDFTGEVVDVEVKAGDVYALAGSARYCWTHEIPASSVRGGQRRLSLTLRKMLPSSWHQQ